MVTPSISVTLAKTGPAVLWSADDKVRDGEIIQINRGLQIMVTTDVFSAIDSWPFQINLTMPTDQVPLGTCTFEFKPLLASALATCGSSPYVSIQGVFRNPKRTEIATISFDTRILYYPGTEHNTTVEIILNRPITSPPPRDDYYRPDLGNSSSFHTHTDSESSGTASNASVETISDSASSYLGGHDSFKKASEANKSKLSAATQNLNSQNSMMRRNSAIIASPRPSLIGGQRSGEISKIQGSFMTSNQPSRRPSMTQKSSMFTDDFVSD